MSDHPTQSLRDLPIGVFDSGIGGLTVLKALMETFPNESFIYLGDTARLPYGTKSPETINRYTHTAAKFLVQRGIKLLVIACNTASSNGLEALQAAFTPLPVIGVIEPGAEAACATTQNGQIAVIATEATVNAQGYQKSIKKILPDAQIMTKSCGLFVPLAEEGLIDGPITEAAVKHYLTGFLHQKQFKPDCLVLGCTHFPVLLPTIKKLIGNKINIVDSAQTTALAVKKMLDTAHLTSLNSHPRSLQFLVTDGPQRFARIAQLFLGQSLTDNRVELVGL